MIGCSAAPQTAVLIETLRALAAQPDIEWSRVTAFHMDEYIGLDSAAPQRFGNWLATASIANESVLTVQLVHVFIAVTKPSWRWTLHWNVFVPTNNTLAIPLLSAMIA